MSTKKTFFGGMVVIMTGTFLGILFTSRKGEIMRKKMLLNANQYGEALKAKFNKSLNKLSNNFDQLYKKVSHPSKMGKNQVLRKEAWVKPTNSSNSKEQIV